MNFIYKWRFLFYGVLLTPIIDYLITLCDFNLSEIWNSVVGILVLIALFPLIFKLDKKYVETKED